MATRSKAGQLSTVFAGALAFAALWGMSASAAEEPKSSGVPRPASVQAGNDFYQQICAACHGAGGTGGPGGAANLTRSPIAMADDGGKTLMTFLANGRPAKGMPAFPIGLEQSVQLSAALRSLGQSAAPAPAPGSGSKGPGTDVVLVGDAAAGRLYFNGPVGRCSSCHSISEGGASSASNLAHIASKYPDTKTLQNNMVLNRTFFWSPSLSKDVSAVITFKDGRVLRGLLTSVSDFKVIIRDQAGKETEISRSNGEPRVALEDRLQHHLDLLEIYRDSDIHDLTAFLATLK